MLPDCSNFLNHSVQTYGRRLPRHECQNHGGALKIPWYLLNEICTVIHLPDCFGKTIRRSFVRTWMGENSELGMYVRERKQGVFLSVYVDDIKIAGKTQNSALVWKKLMKKCERWRTYIISSWPRLLGMHSTWMQTKWKIIEQFSKMFESRISAGATEKLPVVWNTSRKNSREVLRHGRTCSKMRWEILRVGKQKVEQLYKVSSPCLYDY